MNGMKNKKLVSKILSRALETPSFAGHLKKNGFQKTLQAVLAKWAELPPITKQNYIRPNKLRTLLGKDRLPTFMYASSGSSGIPTYWFRDSKQEIAGAKQHEYLLDGVLKIPKDESILIIVGFYMGVWVAGNYTSDAFRRVAETRGNMTVVTPGLEKAKVVQIVEDMANSYKHVILCAYPTFALDIMETLANDRKTPKNFYTITAGASFDEKWRDTACKLLGTKKTNRVISMYGSADLTLIGFETQVSIEVRKAISNSESLKAKLCVPQDCELSVFQYDPNYIFVESVNGELLFTSDTTIPLVRYKMGDKGFVFTKKQLADTLQAEHSKLTIKLKNDKSSLNYIIFTGRNDVALAFRSMYIHPEFITKIVNSNKDKFEFWSGEYLIFTERYASKAHLSMVFVAKKGYHTSAELEKEVVKIVNESLQRLSYEYEKLLAEFGNEVKPTIVITNNLDSLTTPKDCSGLLQEYGKKPRVVFN